MRSAANSDVKMAKAPPVESPIQAYAVRDLTTQKPKKSKPACLHRRGAREKSGILNINTPIFLTLPQEQV